MTDPVSSPTVTAASCGRHELARRDRAEQTRRRHRRAQSRRRESSQSISDADLYSDSSLSGDDLMQRLISRSSSADDVSSSDISSIVPLSPSSSSSHSVSAKKKTDGYAADSDDENKNDDDELNTKNYMNNNIDNIPSLDFAPPKLSPNSRYANRYKLQKPSARKKSSLRRSRRRSSNFSSSRSVSSIRSVESLKTYLKAQRVAFAETVEMFEHSAAGSTVISHISQMSQTTLDTWESLPGTRQQRRITIAVLPLVGLLAYCLCAAGSSKASSLALDEKNNPITRSLRGQELLNNNHGSVRHTRNRRLLQRSADLIDQYPINNLLDATSSDPAPTKTSMYWQIPRTGSTTLKNVLGTCLDRAQASRVARTHCDPSTLPHELTECHVPSLGRFVNVDPSDDGGIERAKDLKLVESGMADVMVTSRFFHAASLYDYHHMGRVFTTMRHPVQRTASLFRHLQTAVWERNYNPRYATMTILDYAKEARETYSDNWMVRWLTGKVADDDLTRNDVEYAKELLRRKFFIIMTDEMQTGIEQLIEYMDWDISDEQRQCMVAKTAKGAAKNRNQGNEAEMTIKEDTPEYAALVMMNNFDIELFEYAQKLYAEQSPDMKKLGDASRLADVAAVHAEMGAKAEEAWKKLTKNDSDSDDYDEIKPPPRGVSDLKKSHPTVAMTPARQRRLNLGRAERDVATNMRQQSLRTLRRINDV